MKQEFYDLAKKIDEWRAETADPEKQITELADCFIVASALWFRFEAA